MIEYVNDTLNLIEYSQLKVSSDNGINQNIHKSMIIPELGQGYLYIYTTADLDGNDCYSVRFILNTNLYTHILISNEEILRFNYDSDLPSQGIQVFEISNLSRDPNNQNIIIIPIPADTNKFCVYLANSSNSRSFYLPHQQTSMISKFYMLNESDIPEIVIHDSIISFSQPFVKNYTYEISNDDLIDLICLRQNDYEGYYYARYFPISQSTYWYGELNTNVLLWNGVLPHVVDQVVFQHRASGKVFIKTITENLEPQTDIESQENNR